MDPRLPKPTIIEPKGAVPKRGPDKFRDIADARDGIDHDTLTAETVTEWKRLIEAKDLKPALGVRGAPSFP